MTDKIKTSVSIAIGLNASNLIQIKSLIDRQSTVKKEELHYLLFRIEEIQEELRAIEEEIFK